MTLWEGLEHERGEGLKVVTVWEGWRHEKIFRDKNIEEKGKEEYVDDVDIDDLDKGSSYYFSRHLVRIHEEFEYKNRQPDTLELNKIIEDYKTETNSLYELADSYDLLINNLFRILKETGMIEKETDAKGYSRFYTEYNGIRFVWDGETEMGLIG